MSISHHCHCRSTGRESQLRSLTVGTADQCRERGSSEVSTPPQVTERWVWPQGTAAEVGLSPFLPMVQWGLRWEERVRPHSGSLGSFLYIRLCYRIQCILSALGLSPGHSADQMLRALWPLISQAGRPGQVTQCLLNTVQACL